ncbi:MAG: hypothetical protein N2504_04080 [candidate division WOR-3 bacterium]|nr:hypothetical protein [candidate division WOR-3 bacterium]MCX7947746.1 hypothetical protein [candidate division WOR-3 bacterium]MDW8150331.1 hypothetical protein [candidate division WOR-3 bacterium]
MLFIFLSQVVFRAESINIYIKDLGELLGIQESYISDNKYRIDTRLILNRERNISKFMEKYYAGNKSLIIDLEKDSVYKIDNDERSYYVYRFDSYIKPIEEEKGKRDIRLKFSIKDLKDCNYEMKFLFDNDSIIAKVCYKDINVPSSQFFTNYNAKHKTEIDSRVFEKLSVFQLNNPLVKLLMSGTLKRNDLEKILKIKGYPLSMEFNYYSDTSLIYRYSSKVYAVEKRESLDVFKIDSSYKLR